MSYTDCQSIRDDVEELKCVVRIDEWLVTKLKQYLSDAQAQSGISHAALENAQAALDNCEATSTTHEPEECHVHTSEEPPPSPTTTTLDPGDGSGESIPPSAMIEPLQSSASSVEPQLSTEAIMEETTDISVDFDLEVEIEIDPALLDSIGETFEEIEPFTEEDLLEESQVESEPPAQTTEIQTATLTGPITKDSSSADSQTLPATATAPLVVGAPVENPTATEPVAVTPRRRGRRGAGNIPK